MDLGYLSDLLLFLNLVDVDLLRSVDLFARIFQRYTLPWLVLSQFLLRSYTLLFGING
jgi:hypothetical protein